MTEHFPATDPYGEIGAYDLVRTVTAACDNAAVHGEKNTMTAGCGFHLIQIIFYGRIPTPRRRI